MLPHQRVQRWHFFLAVSFLLLALQAVEAVELLHAVLLLRAALHSGWRFHKRLCIHISHTKDTTGGKKKQQKKSCSQKKKTKQKAVQDLPLWLQMAALFLSCPSSPPLPSSSEPLAPVILGDATPAAPTRRRQLWRLLALIAACFNDSGTIVPLRSQIINFTSLDQKCVCPEVVVFGPF